MKKKQQNAPKPADRMSVIFRPKRSDIYPEGTSKIIVEYHKPRKAKWFLRELIWIEKTKARRLAKKGDCGKKQTTDIG